MNRRTFLASTSIALLGAGAIRVEGAPPLPDPPLGIVAATLAAHMDHRKRGGLALAELPKVIRGELDIRILDMNTMNFPSFEPALLERFRKVAEGEGCVLTNLKLNQPGLDLGSLDRELRNETRKVYRASVDAAALMGMRWVRPLPAARSGSRQLLVEGLRDLAEYAGRKQIGLLVENYGWMQSDPDAVVDLITEVGHDLAASPDTGNWSNNDIRYAGLAKTFPIAATCDFKVKTLGAKGQHPAYDLERCFRIGRDSGYRGPWCIEHGHRELKDFYREHLLIKEMLERWLRGA